jgi:hypothetical protein
MLKQTSRQVPLTIALVTLVAVLCAPTALASGQIFAEITLTNNTGECIATTSAHTPQLWGTSYNTEENAGSYVVMPDGSPPQVLAPNQTMLWGSKSNGGFGAMTGTGGTLQIPIAGQTLSWSSPWAFFNGNPIGSNCNGKPGAVNKNTFSPSAFLSCCAPDSNNLAAPDPYCHKNGEGNCAVSSGANTCVFAYYLYLKPGMTAPPGSANCNNLTTQGKMLSGQGMSWPTSCPAARCPGGNSVVRSPDGSTTLSIQRTASGLAPSGGALALFSPFGSWRSPVTSAVEAILQPDGDLVAIDASGTVIWNTKTFGYPGSVLTVGSSEAEIVTPRNKVVWSECLCNGACCSGSQTCRASPTGKGVCCASELCGSECCINGETCSNGHCGFGQPCGSARCGFGSTCCNGACCNGTCLPGGSCCSNTKQACGTACCAEGQLCANANTSTCAAPIQPTLFIYSTSTGELLAESGGPPLEVSNNQGLVVTGRYFSPGPVKLTIDSSLGTQVGAPTADAKGMFTTTITTSLFGAGSHQLVATQGSTITTIALTVQIVQ